MKPALLLVDLQADYLNTPALQPPADVLISRAIGLLDQCRRNHTPIIHLWTTIHRDKDGRLPHWREANRWACVAGTSGHKPPQALQPMPGETVVHKTGFNAGAELAAALQQAGCDTVIIAGLHLHACVRSAAVECLERGYAVRIADDATASNDPFHAAATRRWLSERCVRFEPSGVIASRNGEIETALVHYSPLDTSQVLFEVPIAPAAEVADAAQAARRFWPEWRRTDAASRQRLFEAIASKLEDALPALARQMALEIGKPISHAFEESRRAIENVRDVARRAAELPAQKREGTGIVRSEPIGVVALVSPWNNPVAIPLGKIAPALIYGNTVVWKPAPAATGIAQTLMKLLWEAGVPPNALRLVTGDHTTAQRLAAHEAVDAVTLTGSAQAGYAMQDICLRRLIPLQAELSGNNAAIVWDDADLAQAARHVAWGAFAFAGQRCTANRRVIINESRFERFWDELAHAAEELAWGDPLRTETEIGPVISAAKRDELAMLADEAQGEQGVDRVERLHSTLAADPAMKAGAYAQPVMVSCTDPGHTLVQEETMSPLLVVQRAKDFNRAIELCNGVRHGLAAALFSRMPDRQRQFLAEARAGVLKLNTSTAGVDPTLPFGGWKASGIGAPEHGEADRFFYTRLQAVYGLKEP